MSDFEIGRVRFRDWTCPIPKLDLEGWLFFHVPLLVHAEQAGHDLFDCQAADVPAVEPYGAVGRGECTPVGFVELHAAQSLAVLRVGGGVAQELEHVGGQSCDGIGRWRLAVGHAFQREEDGHQVLHHVVGTEACLAGAFLVGNQGFLDGGGGLFLHEVDDVAVGDGLGVLLGELRVDVGGVGHAGAVHLVEVAVEVRVVANHADAEVRRVVSLVVAQRAVELRPAFEDII